MGKFFKGLAASGAWACFDEFNRINIEVLSVIAQQIMTHPARDPAASSASSSRSTDITLDPDFAVFITMNPGYAGRSELPDNLKALFRPVAMMVPDYALIGEIMLFAFGFEDAQACARRWSRRSSSAPSSCRRRPLRLRHARRQVRAPRGGQPQARDPDWTRSVLLLRALQDVNLPKFLAHDLPLFSGIISDLFPGHERPELDYGALQDVHQDLQTARASSRTQSSSRRSSSSTR